jgi:hypothetical protein
MGSTGKKNAGRRTSEAIHDEFWQHEGENDKINRKANKKFYDAPNFADRTVNKTVDNDQCHTNKTWCTVWSKLIVFFHAKTQLR